MMYSFPIEEALELTARLGKETNDMGIHLMNGRIAIAMMHNATSVSFNQDEMDLITKLERSL